MKVCFTGHRPNKLGGYNEDNPLAKHIKRRLAEEIRDCIKAGQTTFISGGALGVDQWAAEIVLLFKKRRPDVQLIIARPFPSQDALWNAVTKERFQKILDAADEVVDVSGDPYSAQKMQLRNQYMVDISETVIAVWDGSKGGTGNCVAYAQKRGKKIIRINLL